MSEQAISVMGVLVNLKWVISEVQGDTDKMEWYQSKWFRTVRAEPNCDGDCLRSEFHCASGWLHNHIH